MRPDLSLILLTVLAGVGQGLFIFLVVLDSLALTGELSAAFSYAAVILSIILPSIGMAASTFHLGNPQIGWKALKMWRNSWLTREIILLPAFLGFAVLYLYCLYSGVSAPVRLITGYLGVLSSMGLYLSSAMLYAAIRYIKEWANAYTVFNFILLGLTSGGALCLALIQLTGLGVEISEPVTSVVIVLGALSLVSKYLSYRHNETLYVSWNLKNALGINDPNIRLIDTGAAYDHYNTTEYHIPVTEKKNRTQQSVVLINGFIVPIAIWSFGPMINNSTVYSVLTLLAAILIVGGLLLERKLFFTQGNHLQNIYYGNFRTKPVKNPILTMDTKQYPSPAVSLRTQEK
ncbi:MAG: dimethyl sulfoxide reductase anchor subunit family protein [Nitrospinota bacterium]